MSLPLVCLGFFCFVFKQRWAQVSKFRSGFRFQLPLGGWDGSRVLIWGDGEKTSRRSGVKYPMVAARYKSNTVGVVL